MQHLHSLIWFYLTILSILSLTAFPLISVGYFIVVVIYGYLERGKDKVFRFHMNISSFFEISAAGAYQRK